MKIVISSGHGKYVDGASGVLGDEVTEARRVVEQLAEELRARGVEVITYADDISHTQDENLERIISFHNAQGPHDLDLSIHFNAHLEPGETTPEPVGTEVFYGSPQELAAQLSAAIARSGFIDRGAKDGSGLAFISGTTAPALLAEICFVDSSADAAIYHTHFEQIAADMAEVLAGDEEWRV